MGRPALDVADIFRAHGPAWREKQAGHLSPTQLKIMSAIEQCRTAALGGHTLYCDTCDHVEVSGGHTGALNPTAQLRPVEIGGTTVSNASLANYDEIARLDVAIGDSVWVVKANDIIPKIIRVTQRPTDRIPILPPVACPFCQGNVGRRQTHDGTEGVIVECRNPECPKKSSGKIRRWIASLDILGIGDSVLAAMLETFALEDAADM